jgi:hypothetical protein
MLKIPSKYEQRYFVIPSPGPPVLLLYDPAGRLVRELWWTNQEISSPNIKL